MKGIVIVGATSGLGFETARLFIEKGWRVGVAGRRQEPLERLCAMAPERVFASVIDITRDDAPARLHDLAERIGGMDIYFHSSGIGKRNMNLDPAIELDTMQTNGAGFVRMITAAYDCFRTRGHGHIAAISSIAGVKGLGSAPAYSATKRMQNTYIDSLAQLARMQGLDIRFTDIRPGFVATPLLAGDKRYPMQLHAERVARAIVRAVEKRKRRVVIDWRYRILVLLWRLIPEWLWERLPIKLRD